MSDHPGPGLHLVPDDADQVLRLQRFRQARPDVDVGCGDGYWQAVIAGPGGEVTVTRHRLGDLLDRLDEITGGA